MCIQKTQSYLRSEEEVAVVTNCGDGLNNVLRHQDMLVERKQSFENNSKKLEYLTGAFLSDFWAKSLKQHIFDFKELSQNNSFYTQFLVQFLKLLFHSMDL